MNKPKPLTPSDTSKLLHACAITTNRHLGDLVEFILLSGCEKFGAMRLTWRDVSFRSKRITLEGRTGKYSIPMTVALADILARRAERLTRLDIVFWTDHKSRNGAYPRAFCEHYVPGGELTTATNEPWTLTDLRATYKAHTKSVLPIFATTLLGRAQHDNIIDTGMNSELLLEAAETVTKSILTGGNTK